MKYSLAALVLAVSAVSADSLIPTGISSTCSTFLTKLNADSSVQSCLKSLVATSSSFSPSSASTGDIKDTLKAICAGKSCTSSFQAQLRPFATACSSDFAKSSEVLNLYDLLYVAAPLTDNLCQVNSATQENCVTYLAKAADKVAASSDTASIANSNNLATVYTPVASTYKETNLAFLFLNSDMADTNNTFCGTCASAVMQTYFKFESNNPYGYVSVDNSPILGGQRALWASMKTKCPAAFITKVGNAGNATVAANGALQRAGGVPTVAALVLGAFTVVIAA